MRCMVCGKGMKEIAEGHYRCTNCGHITNDLVYRPAHCFEEQKGWICPVCGRGLAPWISFCPCQGSEIKITYGTTVSEQELYGLKDYYDLLEKKINRSEDDKL